MGLHCATVKHAAPRDLLAMLRTDSSGQQDSAGAYLAHHELESNEIVVTHCHRQTTMYFGGDFVPETKQASLQRWTPMHVAKGCKARLCIAVE